MSHVLTTADVDAVAHRVVELLRATPDLSAAGLVDAVSLAATLSVSRAFVYDHATELEAIRLGEGPRARLRFDPAAARAAFERMHAPPEPAPDRPRRQRRSDEPRVGGILRSRPGGMGTP